MAYHNLSRKCPNEGTVPIAQHRDCFMTFFFSLNLDCISKMNDSLLHLYFNVSLKGSISQPLCYILPQLDGQGMLWSQRTFCKGCLEGPYSCLDIGYASHILL